MRMQLGPFQILEAVGRGGMGTVYRGLDPIIGRPVAVKVIRLVGYNNVDEQVWLKQRLFSEARAAGNLSHPGIVTIYQVGEANDVAYIAMEFVDGPSLQKILRNGSLDREQMCQVLREAATALDYAHAHGLVHRDVKPANIMVNAAGVTKVTDFGIAKTMLGQTVTKTGVIIGTPYYMSPEQIRGTNLDGRSDQFSLAVVAYEIFTGRKPFVAEQVTSVCYQILHEEPVGPENLNPAVGPEMAAVIRRGMAKDPASRYSTCTEFAGALTAALRVSIDETVSVPPPSAANTPVPDARRRGSSLRAALYASVMMLSILLAAAVALTREGVPAHRESVNPPAGAAPNPTAPSALVPSTAPPPPPAPQQQSAHNRTRKEIPIRNVGPKTNSEFRRGVPAISLPVESERQRAGPVAPLVRKSMLVWTGQAARNDLVTISDTRPSKGAVTGACVPSSSVFTIYPAAWAHERLTVFTAEPRYAGAPILTTPRGPAAFTFDPRHATDLTLYEARITQNGGTRVVVRMNAPVSAFVLKCDAGPEEDARESKSVLGER
jgi:eukaryotic-like serine/threonine-protein kinase